jgi:hypothetical protein
VTASPELEPSLVYIEYLSRRPGVSLEAFWKVVGQGEVGWAADNPDDLLVARIGRTWRVGPEPEYLAIWWTRGRGLDRLDDWETISRQTDDMYAWDAFRLAARVDSGGCYVPLLEPVPVTAERVCLEGFDILPGTTHDDVRAAFRQRAERHPEVTLDVLLAWIGQLGPEPRGLALWGLPAWAALEELARDRDDTGAIQPLTAGLYSELGRETL